MPTSIPVTLPKQLPVMRTKAETGLNWGIQKNTPREMAIIAESTVIMIMSFIRTRRARYNKKPANPSKINTAQGT